MEVITDSSGRITGIQANPTGLNALATQTAISAQAYISQIGAQRISIPIGSALGSNLLSGKGPNVSARAIPSGAVTSSFYSEFSSAGYNQTLHRIYITLKANMMIILPTASASEEVVAQVLVAENVLVGEVPNTLLQMDGLAQKLDLVP